MKKIYFLLFSLFLICCISACQKNGSGVTPVQSNPIVGKWNLQQQKYTQYVDGVKQPDMTFTTSNNDIAYAKFDNNGNYVSVTQSILSSAPVLEVAKDTLSGTYSLLNNTFTLSGGYLSSLYAVTATPVFNSVTDTYTIQPLSHSVQINQLTSNLLTLHFEVVANYNYSSGVSTNYKTVSDLYYSK
ncbi:MAG: hypothetical protein JWQ66_4027 [Mucilaginibacter sp.]|nr:hypothetical protein [Mucilaginibacter sp.]